MTNIFSGRPLLGQWLVCSGLILTACLVNALSLSFDIERNNGTLELWKPYCWELTSWAGWAVVFALLLPADAKLAARHGWLARLGFYVPLSLLCSILHVALMIGLRVPLHALAGEAYRFEPLLPNFFYEYRKDLLTFILAVGLAGLWRAGLRRREEPAKAPAAPAAEPTFLVPGKDGEVLVRAGEIDWIEAQGNYVALHVGGQEKLLRLPLKEVEARLADTAFIRTHRSALVNMRRVKAVTRGELGEIRVEFDNRNSAPLSASRRADVMKALEAHS